MNWVLLALVLAVTVYTYATMPKLGGSAQEWGDCPTAEEGLPIPVVFGTVMISRPNITWFSDQSAEAETQLDPPSIHYSAAVQFSLCHGCIDKLVSVSVGGNEIWRGPHDDNAGVFDPDAKTYLSAKWDSPSDGDGVLGQFVLERGYLRTVTDDGTPADKADSDYFLGKLGGTKVWKSHGVATLKPWCSWYLGNAPALKPWAFRVQRIFRADGGQSEQWYPEKAAIVIGRNLEDTWKWKLQAAGDSTDYKSPTYDDSGWSEGPGGFGNEQVGAPGQGRDPKWASRVPKVGTCVADSTNAWTWSGQTPPHVTASTKLWLRRDLGPLPNVSLYVRAYHDDSAVLYFNGTAVTLTPFTVPKDGQAYHFNSFGTIPASLVDPDGPNVVAFKVTDSAFSGLQNPTYIYAGLSVGIDPTSYAATWDMNPAHIIREVLTDTVWGLGYAAGDVDDTAFTAAADTLYDEGLGLSVLWDSQSTYEEFLQSVLRHIDGVLYVDRTTGKWVLKLLREDYSVPGLLTLDYDNVGSVQSAVRKSTAELVNAVTVNYRRAPLGNTGSMTVHDYGLMQEQGGYVGEKLDFPYLTNAHAANLVAQRCLKAMSTPLLSCTLVNCNREAADLNVGDAFVLDWPELEINQQVMRVTSIKLGGGTSSAVTVECVEDVFFTPTEPLVVPAGIAWPPQVLGPLPGTTEQTTYKTVRKYDPNDRGTVACCFLGAHAAGGNTPMFGMGLFTESPAGVMTSNDELAIPAAWFDGASPSVGDTVMAWWHVGNLSGNAETAAEAARQGLYRIDSLGSTGNPAKFTRLENYDANTDFVPGMTFKVLAGDAYANAYLTLGCAVETLGTSPMVWTASAGETFDDGAELLTEAEIAQSYVSGEVLDISVTVASGTAVFDIAFLSRVLEVASFPAGPWTFSAEAVWLTADDPAATITLGWTIHKSNGVVGSTLFEALTSAIHNTTPEPKTVVYDAPEFVVSEDEYIVLLLSLHTTSASPVTLNLRYNSPDRRTGVTIPFEAYKKDITRRIKAASSNDPTFANGVIVVKDLTKPVSVTIPAGSTVVGIQSPAPTDGLLMPLTIYGATNEDPITIAHNSDYAPDTAKTIWLSSEAGMGATFEDLIFFATRARLLLSYNAAEGNWQLMPGGAIA